MREADLLLHVADASIDRCEEHIGVVNGVLEEVLERGGREKPGDGARRGPRDDEAPLASVPTALVLNKIDLIEDSGRRNALRVRHPDAVLASAATGEGTEELLEIVESHLGRELIEAEVLVSPEEGRAIALIERSAKVLSRKLAGDRMVFRIRIRKREIAILEKEKAVRVRRASSS